MRRARRFLPLTSTGPDGIVTSRGPSIRNSNLSSPRSDAGGAPTDWKHIGSGLELPGTSSLGGLVLVSAGTDPGVPGRLGCTGYDVPFRLGGVWKGRRDLGVGRNVRPFPCRRSGVGPRRTDLRS